MTPDQLFYLIVLLGALLVFVSDSIGNMLAFGNRIVNALTTAIVWMVLFIILYFVLAAVDIQLTSTLNRFFVLAIMGGAFVFVSDMIGNIITFGNRFLNALTTTIVWAALYGAARIYGLV